LSEIDSTSALSEAKRLSPQASKGKLSSVIKAILMNQSTIDSIFTAFEKMPYRKKNFRSCKRSVTS